MKTSIGEKICECRKANAWTQEQLGAKIGVSAQAVSKWECGESYPDILLLPQLCELLGVSVDVLLEVPSAIKNRSMVQDFCAYAAEKGKNETVMELMSKLDASCDSAAPMSTVSFSPDGVRVYDKGGTAFIVDNAALLERCLHQEEEDVAFFLRPLLEPTIMSVLKLTTMEQAVTREEIMQALSIDEETVNRVLLGLMKRNVVVCDVDRQGKRGYLQGSGMAGIYMILAGCRTLNRDGALQGNLWFTRQSKQG